MNPRIKKLQQDKKGFFVLLGFKGDCEQIRAINSDFADTLIMSNDFILSEDEDGFKTWDFEAYNLHGTDTPEPVKRRWNEWQIRRVLSTRFITMRLEDLIIEELNSLKP